MNARTENDHRELASAYEQQVGLDRDSSERHRKLALGDSGLARPVGNIKP